MVSDTVGDFIIQIKNAGMVKKSEVIVPYSKLKHAIADLLVQEGYVTSVAVTGEGVTKELHVTLLYSSEGVHRINDVKRVSKPGRRLYAKSQELYPVKFGKGRLVMSTPKGIITSETARKENVGGEQLFMIW